MRRKTLKHKEKLFPEEIDKILEKGILETLE